MLGRRAQTSSTTSGTTPRIALLDKNTSKTIPAHPQNERHWRETMHRRPDRHEPHYTFWQAPIYFMRENCGNELRHRKELLIKNLPPRRPMSEVFHHMALILKIQEQVEKAQQHRHCQQCKQPTRPVPHTVQEQCQSEHPKRSAIDKIPLAKIKLDKRRHEHD